MAMGDSMGPPSTNTQSEQALEGYLLIVIPSLNNLEHSLERIWCDLVWLSPLSTIFFIQLS